MHESGYSVKEVALICKKEGMFVCLC